MKRLYVILLLFIYCLSATGATVYLHYCCGEVDAISLTQKEKDDASCQASCPMSRKSAPEEKEIPGCCDEKKVEAVKATGQHVVNTLYTMSDLMPALVLVLQYHMGVSADVAGLPAFSPDTSPPDVRQSPIYLLNCTYRI